MRNLTCILTNYLTLFFIFLFLNCHKDVSGNSFSQYYPNNVGDSWIYDVTDSTQSSPTNPSPPQHYMVTVTITGTKTLIDGNQYVVWQYQYLWGNDTNFVKIVDDTLKIFSLTYSRTITDLNYPRDIFILPFQNNYWWNGLLLNTDTSRVVSQSEMVITSNQTFTDCFEIYHHYNGYNTELNDYYWFRPNIGMVKIFYFDYNNGPSLYRTWILRSYHIQ
jgi:hypothetical protein